MVKKYIDLSVIIPFYDADSTIENTLDSILYQTVLPRQVLIIVDGCNSSYLRYVCNLRKFEDLDINIIILDVNQGVSNARNIGISKSKFDLIAFLDSDDVWHPQKIEFQYSFMKEKNLSFSYHKYHDTPIPFQTLKGVEYKSVSKYNFILKQHIATPTVMVRKESFIPFNSQLSYCEDYHCWLMNMNNGVFFYLDEYLSHGFKKAIGVSGLSSNIRKMHRGYIQANIDLLINKKITILFFVFSVFFEYCKYPLRYLKRLKK